MREHEFNIPGEIRCVLKYLSDPEFISDINPGYEKDVLYAVCYPEKTPLTSSQIQNYSIDIVFTILEELKKIEEANPSFYNHFEINYNKPHFGPMTGNPSNKYYKFELKPKIKFKI